jgi:hypothetical protein
MNQPAPESSLGLEGPAGYLENLYRATPTGVRPRAAAVLCHPHPLFGGTMHNKTLYRLAKRLSVEAHMPSLRFNFRGTGRSLGRFDGGLGETADVRAATDRLAREHPGLPITIVGYSFGAVAGLRAGATDPRVTHLVALGTPVAEPSWDVEHLRSTDKPRLLVQGENDEFGGAEAIRSFAASAIGPVDVHVVPAADHLFHGVEDAAVEAVVTYIQRHAVSV